MQLKLDVKTLIVGIALGVIVTAAIGASVGAADAARFGIAIAQGGSAIVKTDTGGVYIISTKNGMATRVLLAGQGAEPGGRRDSRAGPFSLTGPGRTEPRPGRIP
jgi:hypothetical protein